MLCAVLAACATVPIPPPGTLLGEDQIIDLMVHAGRWHGRVVTVRIYPYDMGASQTYIVCFDRCDEAAANRSGFLIDTRPDRFKGYRGDRPVVVTARYASNCAPPARPGAGPWCPDFYTDRFTEVD